MPSKKSAASNTRNLFNKDHSAGKGDKSRITDTKAFRDNYDEINWGWQSAARVHPCRGHGESARSCTLCGKYIPEGDGLYVPFETLGEMYILCETCNTEFDKPKAS